MYDNKEKKSVCNKSLGHAQTGRNEQETETKRSCSEGVGDAQIEATSPVKAQHESALAALKAREAEKRRDAFSAFSHKNRCNLRSAVTFTEENRKVFPSESSRIL